MAETTLKELQKVSSFSNLVLSVSILFVTGMSMGGSYVYGGLTLEAHMDDDNKTEERAFIKEHMDNNDNSGEERAFIQLSQEEASWYISLVPLFQMIGIVAGYPTGEWLGRKKVLLLTSVLNILGFTIMFYSHGFWLLAIGRSINSFSIGFGSMMPYILVSEITTIRARAPTAVVNTLAFAFGGLFAFLVAHLLPLIYLLHTLVLLSILFLLLSPLLPESPHFLARNSDVAQAKEVLAWLRGKAYKGVEQEIEEVLALCEVKGVQAATRWSQKTFLHPLALLLTLFAAVSLSGLDCPLNFYGPSIFADFG